jgi:hypothetical protein
MQLHKLAGPAPGGIEIEQLQTQAPDHCFDDVDITLDRGVAEDHDFALDTGHGHHDPCFDFAG